MMNIDGEFNSALYGTLGALLAGALFKFLNRLFDKPSINLQEHISLRKELREELDAVKAELHELQKDLDEWKERYYHQVELTNDLKIQLLNLTDELSEYKKISGIHPTEIVNDVG